MGRGVGERLVRWGFARAAIARGWWLCTGLYLVTVAHLSASQLVGIGVAQGLTVLVAEVPAGVLADASSRRRTLVVGHLVMGFGMALTGLVTAYPLLVLTQCAWGLGWAISSGADVAWVTDELEQPELVDDVLTSASRAALIGTVVGLLGIGGLALATSLGPAIVVAGVAMVALGILVVGRWPETWDAPVHDDRRQAARSIIGGGVRLVQRDRTVALVVASTAFVHGGYQGFGRLFERRLLGLGLPDGRPVAWFAAIAVTSALGGALVLHAIRGRLTSADGPRVASVVACVTAAVGVAVFAVAPNAGIAVVGSLLVTSLGMPTIRVGATLLVNRRTTSDVRATVHSMLSQAENLGEIVGGLAMVAVAQVASGRAVLLGSAALMAIGGVVVGRATVGPWAQGWRSGWRSKGSETTGS